MPIYDYQCENPDCRLKFEKLVQKVNDDPQTCPRCGIPAKKIDSVPGQFQWGKTGSWSR